MSLTTPLSQIDPAPPITTSLASKIAPLEIAGVLLELISAPLPPTPEPDRFRGLEIE